MKFEFDANEKITISKKEYFALICRDIKLDILECNGVDNWGGYDLTGYDDQIKKEYQVIKELKDG
jgi:hypothetical protein